MEEERRIPVSDSTNGYGSAVKVVNFLVLNIYRKFSEMYIPYFLSSITKVSRETYSPYTAWFSTQLGSSTIDFYFRLLRTHFTISSSFTAAPISELAPIFP